MTVRQLVYATICYADVFSYPLSARELSRWMIGVSSFSHAAGVSGILRKRDGGETFYMLAGREAFIARRRLRRESGREKWRSVYTTAMRLGSIPGVMLIGVTGGLAMNNAAPEDDIDLFFITAPGAMWITRLLVTVAAELFSMRRHPRDTRVAGKVCLNMFMDGGNLSLPAEDRDLFAAHEVLQMEPVWETKGVYRKFLGANAWTRDFLPNAWEDRHAHRKTEGHAERSYDGILLFFLRLAEPAARLLQLWYMDRRRTSEVIGKGMIRFHPKDARIWVKKKFALRLKKRNIPLDKIFYHP